MGPLSAAMTFLLHEVFRRSRSGVLARYRCFEIVGQGFCIQNVDFFSAPPDAQKIGQLERLFFELLFEESPEDRSPGFPHAV